MVRGGSSSRSAAQLSAAFDQRETATLTPLMRRDGRVHTGCDMHTTQQQWVSGRKVRASIQR